MTQQIGLLDGLTVLDFSQFLSGPSAALRLADLGARVIKVEKPEQGDICRKLYVAKQKIAGDSTIFHAINRNKEGISIDLKSAKGLRNAKVLIQQADVMIQNFRPGVIERLGLGYEEIKQLNSKLIYASVSGYGMGNVKLENKPGQDLLAQSISGLTWLNSSCEQPPTPFGLAIADLSASYQLVQGILALLVRRAKTGLGGKVDVSLLESLMDLQFEVFSNYLNGGEKKPRRCSNANAHALMAAPYGIYQTQDGYIAIANTAVNKLGEILGLEELRLMDDSRLWFTEKTFIFSHLQNLLVKESSEHWLDILNTNKIWCSPVLDWPELFATEAFKQLDFFQLVQQGQEEMRTTRCPISIDGEVTINSKGSPTIGADNARIYAEFGLEE
ncbi:CaiB/BaiF CoA transferase family protein [Thaumasiovibrio sp. DFM-14]|uniref:CaiB/BaiF CoA transferase family protein n=1 Tax=Thaumasiovibrio sp. DFM-14 TaxID=3384792 RepID=UPI0039A1E8A4